LFHFGLKLTEDGSEDLELGDSLGTRIFDYRCVTAHWGRMNNGRLMEVNSMLLKND
jgi:hypothetical protein